MSERIIKTQLAGKVYVVLTVALGVIAINSANNLLYLLTSLLLGVMLASGIAGRRNLYGASAHLELPDEIYAGLPCSVTVRLSNHRCLAALYLIDVGVSGTSAPAFFGRLHPNDTASRTIRAVFPRRGRHVVTLELSSVYPFNFFTRFRSLPPVTATIFPQPLFGAESLGAETDSVPSDEAPAARPVPEDLQNAELAGLRAYQTGDPPSRIHWKASARLGKLCTRLVDAPESRPRVIDLDRLLRQGVERGLSLAAGVILEESEAGRAVGLKDGDDLFPPSSGPAARRALMTRLAEKGLS